MPCKVMALKYKSLSNGSFKSLLSPSNPSPPLQLLALGLLSEVARGQVSSSEIASFHVLQASFPPSIIQLLPDISP